MAWLPLLLFRFFLPHWYVETSLFRLLCSKAHHKGSPHVKKIVLSAIARITSPPHPSPQFGQLVPLSLDVKNDVLAPITEPSNDDYDNGVSDNCDQNFGTFDDFGVKNDQKVSHNMILMSKYKGTVTWWKKGSKICICKMCTSEYVGLYVYQICYGLFEGNKIKMYILT